MSNHPGEGEKYGGIVERRQTLTPADVEVLRSLINEMVVPHVCTLGLTPVEVWTFRQHLESGFTQDQVSKVKSAISAFNKLVNVVGYLVVVAVVGGTIVLLSKGFWVTLFEGAAKGK